MTTASVLALQHRLLVLGSYSSVHVSHSVHVSPSFFVTSFACLHATFQSEGINGCKPLFAQVIHPKFTALASISHDRNETFMVHMML